jgi:hypothetical protein
MTLGKDGKACSRNEDMPLWVCAIRRSTFQPHWHFTLMKAEGYVLMTRIQSTISLNSSLTTFAGVQIHKPVG